MHRHLTFPIWQLTVRAQGLASAAGETQVEPEHLLAALLRETDGVAALLFADLGAVPADVVATLAANIALRKPTAAPPPNRATSTAAPASATASDGIVGTAVYAYPVPEPVLSARAERVLDIAHEESVLLGHDRMRVDHVLLGLIREHDGASGRTLAGHCITLERARRAVLHVRATYGPEPAHPLSGRMVTYTYDMNGGLIGRTA